MRINRDLIRKYLVELERINRLQFSLYPATVPATGCTSHRKAGQPNHHRVLANKPQKSYMFLPLDNQSVKSIQHIKPCV